LGCRCGGSVGAPLDGLDPRAGGSTGGVPLWGNLEAGGTGGWLAIAAGADLDGGRAGGGPDELPGLG